MKLQCLAILIFGFLLVGVVQVPGQDVSVYQTPNAPMLGCAWYPEQWPEAEWEHDLTAMQQAGFTVVRVGEFAWSSLEPREGDYRLDWLARAVHMAGQHGLRVVIGTPTDAPPAWLTDKYPQTLGWNADGHRREHGGRRQFNYADPLYRRLCADIVRRLADRFGNDPDVIGWQIDNEYTDESFDAVTKQQFQAYLKGRYGTLDELNRRWATAYWSQTYSAWSQIPMEASSGNPGLLLEHKHFVTATWRSFQQNQIDVLRRICDHKQFITTNIGGLAWSDNWDHYAITAPLNLASWDEYVGEGHLNVAREAMLNDFARGWKRANFWLMETQPGSVNWAPVNNALSPGETRALAWQAIGHGADAILYWQWRPALNGQEQYHGSVVGPGGEPTPLYAELQQLGRDLKETRTAIANTKPYATTALLHTYDSRWAIDFQQHSKLYDQESILQRFYSPIEALAMEKGEAVDIIDPTRSGSLASYKLLVAPSLNVIDEPLAAKLLEWVRDGGILLLGPRSGMKDQYNSLQPQRQPGPLAEALGAKVEQFYALDHDVTLTQDSKQIGSGDIWAEPLDWTAKQQGSVLLRFQDPGGWLDGKPAMVERSIGRGHLIYLGALPDAATLAALLQRVSGNLDAKPSRLHAPPGVEICVRRGDSREVVIVINHSGVAQQLALPGNLHAVLPTGADARNLYLASQSVAVFTQPLERNP